MELIKHLGLSVITIAVLFPLCWILLQSFKLPPDTIAFPPKFVFHPTLDNYLSVFHRTGFVSAFQDSLIVSLGSVGIAMLVGTPFGYALSRFSFVGKRNMAFFVLSTRMLPPIVVIIPFVRIFNYLRIIDTRLGLITAGVLVNLALVVWITRAFFSSVPREIEEAALIDGCSYFKAFVMVTLPLIVPGLVATFILGYMFAWNEFIFALTLTSFNVRTLPVYMATEFVGYLAIRWGELSAAGVIAILPSLVFVAVTQRYLVQGLTFGAIK